MELRTIDGPSWLAVQPAFELLPGGRFVPEATQCGSIAPIGCQQRRGAIPHIVGEAAQPIDVAIEGRTSRGVFPGSEEAAQERPAPGSPIG